MAALLIKSALVFFLASTNLYENVNGSCWKEPIKFGLESLCDGSENTFEAKCLQEKYPFVYQKSLPIVRMSIQFEEYIFPHCTGFFIGSEGHILTNQHCIENEEMLRSIFFEIGAEGDSCATSCNSDLACPGLIFSNITNSTVEFISTGGSFEKGDWSLVKVHEEVAVPLLAKYGYLKFRPSRPTLMERIFIPGHPSGWGKRISIYGNNSEPAQVRNIDVDTGKQCGQAQVQYVGDTQGGSSGSPLVSFETGEVIALHHCGGCESTTHPFNHAINAKDLVQALKKKNILPKDSVSV
jgi:lysyl endopeptidase